MDRWEAEMGRVREGQRREEKRREEEGKGREEKRREGKGRRNKKEDQKKESFRRKIQAREKVGKSRNAAFFQWFVAPEGRTVGSLKRQVRSHVVKWEMKSCAPLWREARFQVKMYKIPQLRSAFRSCVRCEKVHAVAARSTFPSQKCKNWRVQSAFGSWDVERCTPLWREGHFEVKSAKNWEVRSTFGSWDVEKAHAFVARSTLVTEKAKDTSRSDHSWKLGCRKSGILPHIGPINQPKFKHNIPDRGSRDPTLLWSY